ncbi:MAG: PaaI family thioesterase [Cyanobacteria bacterium REEB67]|nr:PaaI family thioesterase [Cyanobacteria bacterium REEB67]
MSGFDITRSRPLRTPNPDFAEKIRDSFEHNGVVKTLGGRLIKVEAGFVEVHLPFSQGAAQQHGFFHGGMVATVADTASGFAGYSVCDVDEECLSAEFKVNFLAPARGELLIGRGSIIKDGRTLIIAQAVVSVVRDGEEIACAFMLHTLARTRHVKSGEKNDKQ